ncbi:hypothetical protein [Geodermatophilus sp. YIM 151500]|uniref:hypothetical protein n=1 Tax=Geodermatophilus sp. YIM 151500 TaxID=2984531 RepID=UPI00398D1A23
MSYAVHGGGVVFPARRDSPVCTAVRGAVVTFRVDSWSGEDRTGWSVTVVGPSSSARPRSGRARRAAGVQPAAHARPLLRRDPHVAAPRVADERARPLRTRACRRPGALLPATEGVAAGDRGR